MHVLVGFAFQAPILALQRYSEGESIAMDPVTGQRAGAVDATFNGAALAEN